VKLRLFAAVAGLLIFNGLILINSRGAFLGAAAGFGYFVTAMMFSKYKLPKQRIFIVILVFASIAAVFRFVDETFIERMLTLQDQTTINDQGSGSRRVHFWIATFDLLRDHPLGTGIYGFETLSPIYLDDPTYFTTEYGDRVRSVHSIWFQSLSEIGWLGFAAFLMVLLSLYRHLKKAKNILVKSNKYKQFYFLIAIEAGLLGFLISCTFINMFRSQILYWMLLFGISASVVMIRNYEKTGSEEDNKKFSKATGKSAGIHSP
jgi:O-antigen ligase